MTGIASDWLTKAHDDLRTVELLGKFPEYPCVVAAFHCQQAVEKSLKAFLTARNVEFLYRHDLGYLLDLCRDVDPGFAALESQIEGLTPYAVEMRYPADLPLAPTREDVEQFYRQAQTVYEFVVSRCAA
jgi:HEPN domain-containing protein